MKRIIFDYLFMDNESGEKFFIETDSFKHAEEILEDNFNTEELREIEFIGIYTPEEAEILGYDTY